MLSKLIRQTGTLISGNLSASVLNFFSVAISLKALGVESFGEVTLLQAYILVLSLCFNPQAWQGVIRYFYLEKDKASLILLTLKYDLICALIGTLIAICFAQTYAESFNLQHHTELLQWCSVYILLNQTSVAIGVLRYQERYNVLAVQAIVSAVLFFLCVLLGYWKNFGVGFFVTAYLLTLGVGVIYIQCHSSRYVASLIKRQSDCNLLSNGKKKEFNSFNLTVHMTSLADIPVKQLDTILVGAVVSVGAAGAYRVIKQIATISTRLTSPLNQVLYPEINVYLAEKAYGKVEKVMSKIVLLLLLPSLAFVAVASMTFDYWVVTLFSAELLVYKWHIVVFMIVHAVSAALTPIHPVFLALGYVKSLLLITLFSNLVLCLGILVLGAKIELWGVLFAIFAQYLLTIACKLPVILSRLRKEKNEGSTLHT